MQICNVGDTVISERTGVQFEVVDGTPDGDVIVSGQDGKRFLVGLENLLYEDEGVYLATRLKEVPVE